MSLRKNEKHLCADNRLKKAFYKTNNKFESSKKHTINMNTTNKGDIL